MKKAIAQILAVILCFSSLSVGALADNEDETAQAAAASQGIEEVLSDQEEALSLDTSAEPTDAEDTPDADETLASQEPSAEGEELPISEDEEQAEELPIPEEGEELPVSEEETPVDETDATEADETEEEPEADATEEGIDDVDALTTDSATVTPMDFSGKSNGWNYIGDHWYYVKNGASVRGWIKSGGVWYYLDPSDNGAMATGWFDVPGDTLYYFNSSGAMKTGWVYTDSTWRYLRSSGRLLTGWLKDGGLWYYLDGDKAGAMATGWYDVPGDTTYYFNSSGAMKTGWIYNDDDSAWRYMGSSGRLMTGWMKTGSVWTTKWYYLDPANNGDMATGWIDVDGSRYYMNSSGVMQTGWLSSGGSAYYLSVTGKMATGWMYIGSSDYYFYTEDDVASGTSAKAGVMAKNTEVDGRTVDSNGTATSASSSVVEQAQYYSSGTSNLLLLDRSSSKLYVFNGSTNNWSLSSSWDCAAGTSSTPTPSGTYTVQDRGYYFDSGSARCFWWTQFYGSYCFHSTLYYQNSTSVSSATSMNSSLGSNISHGCVRLKTSNAKWVYDNVSSGTTVVVY
jgi:glucan-binding YG repeat protein